MMGNGVIVGFPKCGTSALCRTFEKRDGAHFLRTASGQMEYHWPLIDAFEREKGFFDHDGVRVHKFTAYIYNERALRYLAALPARRFLVCIRDPLKALVSWHNMHRKIATDGRSPEHFAWTERDFYATCTLDAYYDRFARSRLRYDHHIRTLFDLVGAERVMVVSQERMACGIDSVADAAIAFFQGRPVPPGALSPQPAGRYQSYADQTGDVVDSAIRAELQAVDAAVHETIRRSGVTALVEVPATE